MQVSQVVNYSKLETWKKERSPRYFSLMSTVLQSKAASHNSVLNGGGGVSQVINLYSEA